MSDALEVWIDDAPVGDVQIERRAGHTTESMTFGYRDGWLSRVDAFAISPDLPLQRGPQVPAHHRSTFLAFDDAAPDAWGRGLLRAASLADAQSRIPPRGERVAARSGLRRQSLEPPR